jgi:malonate-semialdehyde dehydrogenase (acetylating)/methylmalonate-semialdehyde dehydrogenase
MATIEQVDAAVAAALAAFEEWCATPPQVRARAMFRFRDMLEQHRDRLATIITREHGRVFSDAQGEVTRGLEVVEFACGIPQLLKGEFGSVSMRTCKVLNTSYVVRISSRVCALRSSIRTVTAVG